VRSSDSDGIHVYYFLPELLPTFGLASAIRFALEDAGLELRRGQLESFPNTKAYGSLYNGCRLPLQVGSYLLDDDAQPLSDDLAQFLDFADVAAVHQDLAAIKEAIAAAKKRPKHKHAKGVSNDVYKRRREIEEEIAEGWTGFHQTNNLLIRIANHARYWLDLCGQELADYIKATAIAAPGYKEYCRHQHEIGKRSAEVAKMAELYWTPYCSYPDRYGKSYQANFGQHRQQNNIVEFPNQVNVKRSQQAAERIQQAVNHLEATNMLPAGVTARAAAIITTVKELTGDGLSHRTLYRPYHLSLWHPGHQKTPEPAQGGLFYPVLDDNPDQKTPEPAQGGLFYPVSPYEVCVSETCLLETSQKVSKKAEEDLIFPEEEEREEEVLPAAVTKASQPSAPAGLPITPEQPSAPAGLPITPEQPSALAGLPITPEQPSALATLKIPTVADPEASRRFTRIYLAARSYAEKTVKQQAVSEGRIFPLKERSQLLTAAMWRFVWESGEPLYMDQVRQLVKDQPDILPEAELMGFAAATQEQPCNLPAFEASDCIWWDGCPNHCSWMNPFTIAAIDGDLVWLEFYFEPVPMSQLRRCIDS